MKNKINLIVLSILLIGIATAGILNNYDRNINIDDNLITAIETNTPKQYECIEYNITNEFVTDCLKYREIPFILAPETSEIICDDEECFSTIYQYKVINREWRIKNVGNSTEELKQMLDDYIKLTLETRAEGIIERNARKESEEEKVSGGTATIV